MAALVISAPISVFSCDFSVTCSCCKRSLGRIQLVDPVSVKDALAGDEIESCEAGWSQSLHGGGPTLQRRDQLLQRTENISCGILKQLVAWQVGLQV